MNIKQTITVGIAMIMAIPSGCVNNNLDPYVKLPATVSFQKNILPIFRTHCSITDCHSASHPQGNLDLSDKNAYAQLWRHQQIDTVNTTISVLYIQMNSVSNPMPPDGRLDDRSIQMVLKWIQQKAKNN